MRSYQIVEFAAPLETRTAPTPQPQGTEVLVAVTASGVCHSDLHLWAGYFDMGGGRRIDLGRGLQLPLTPGHEVLGTVAAVGSEVRGVKVGDRRIVYPWIGCETCADCRGGRPLLCARPRTIGVNRPGGYATHVLVPDPRYLVEFDDIDENLACTCACSGITAYSALKKVGPLTPEDTLVVIGAGGVGLNAALQATQIVPGRLVVADADPEKRKAVAALCPAAHVVDNTAAEAARLLTKETGGGASAVVDFVGRPETARFGFDVLRRGAKLVIVGLYGGEAGFPLPMFPLKAVTVEGSYVGTLAEMHELMALVKAGNIPALPVTPRPLAEVNAVLDDLRAGRITGRVVLKPDMEPAF